MFIQGDALGDGGAVEWEDVRELFVNEANVFAQNGAGVGQDVVVQ